MAFMTLKTIVFKNKKTLFNVYNFSFLLFSVYLLPSLVNYRSNMSLLFVRKGESVQNVKFLKEFKNLWIRHGFFAQTVD